MIIDGSPLSIDEVVAVASGGTVVTLGDDLEARMTPACELIDEIVANNDIALTAIGD